MKEITLQNNIETIPRSPVREKQSPEIKEKSFGEILKRSIGEVNQLQKSADQIIQELATGKNENIHETMIALEKADVSFQLLMQVRNKVVEAYQEISRMQV